MPRGPRCLNWWMVRPSGPAARELPLFRMALATMSGVKGEAVVFRGHLLSRSRFTRRASGSEEWGMIDVNCLLKAVDIPWLRVRVLLLKVMGWLGRVWIKTP